MWAQPFSQVTVFCVCVCSFTRVIRAHLENEEMNDSGLSHTLSHLILTVVSEIHTIITILQIQKPRPRKVK